jgi:CheY-like chemotaxis protein
MKGAWTLDMASQNPSSYILIVDDDPDSRIILDESLTSIGLETRLAEDGQKALDLITADGALPGLILLDIMMPNMDGLSFLSYLRKQTSEDIPVIVISALSGPLISSMRIANVVHVMRKAEFNLLHLRELVLTHMRREG